MFIMPELVVRKVLEHGVSKLREDKPAFYNLFRQYEFQELQETYGPNYLDEVWKWFSTTKIPVVQAWSLNPQRIPCISVHLANETEDESKAAMNDLFGLGEDEVIKTGVFTAMVDIGVHANRAGDHVLWLYYIVAYILFKHKGMAERLGLRLHTFSASDYNKEAQKMGENIWTRWVRFRCTTENFLAGEPLFQPEEINTSPTIGMDPSQTWSVSATSDVDISTIDMSSNKGLVVSRAGDILGVGDVPVPGSDYTIGQVVPSDEDGDTI